jgi:hypothetical protein
MKINTPTVLVIILFYLSSTTICHAENKKNILGNAETVVLFPNEENLPVQAKFDTGADTSSLSAQDIKAFSKDNKKYVKFTINHRSIPFSIKKTLPIVRRVRIKNHRHISEAAGVKDRRPVVTIKLCIGNIIKDIDVNLVDRANFYYPLLIGKDAIIKLNAVIDPSIENTLQPECNK